MAGPSKGGGKGHGGGHGGGHKGGKHGEPGAGGHKEHAPKVEEKFSAVKMMADDGYVKFVEAYAAANKLDTALLSIDDKQLEAIWKKYLIKQAALKEFTDFYAGVLEADVGIVTKAEPESNKFLAEVDAHLAAMATKNGYDPVKKLQAIKKITSLQGQSQIDMIQKSGLEAEYFPLGFVDENRLHEDERNLTLVADRLQIKKDLEAIKIHSLTDPLFGKLLEVFKKKKLKRVEDEMATFGISLEDPTLDGTDKIKKITEEIHHFKHAQEAVREAKHTLEHELEVHVGGVVDANKSGQLAKAQERLKKLDRILVADRSEQLATIKAIGQKDRYIIPGSQLNFALRDKIDLKKIKHDIVQLKAALTEHGLHTEALPDVQQKKEKLEKLKKHLLESKLGARTALQVAQETLFEKLAWLMSEEHVLAQESKDLVDQERAWNEDRALALGRQKALEAQILPRLKNWAEENERLEKYKKDLREDPPDDPAEEAAEAAVLKEEERRLKQEKNAIDLLSKKNKKEEDQIAKARIPLDEMAKKQDRLAEVVRHYEKAKKHTSIEYLPPGSSQKSFSDVVERAKNIREERVQKNIEIAIDLLSKTETTEKAFSIALDALKLSPQERKRLLKVELVKAQALPISVVRQRWLAEAIKKCNQ